MVRGEESAPYPRTGGIRQISLAPVRVGCEEAVTRCSAGTEGNVSNRKRLQMACLN